MAMMRKPMAKKPAMKAWQKFARKKSAPSMSPMLGMKSMLSKTLKNNY